MKTNTYREIARIIARDLFTEGGTNKHANRLVLKHGPIHAEKDGAGWAEGPMRDRIEMILNNNKDALISAP